MYVIMVCRWPFKLHPLASIQSRLFLCLGGFYCAPIQSMSYSVENTSWKRKFENTSNSHISHTLVSVWAVFFRCSSLWHLALIFSMMERVTTNRDCTGPILTPWTQHGNNAGVSSNSMTRTKCWRPSPGRWDWKKSIQYTTDCHFCAVSEQFQENQDCYFPNLTACIFPHDNFITLLVLTKVEIKLRIAQNNIIDMPAEAGCFLFYFLAIRL